MLLSMKRCDSECHSSTIASCSVSWLRNERFVVFKEEDEDGREMMTEEEE